MPEPIRIYDTTLRDGLRNSGVAIDLDDKIRFAQQLERLGVDAIEVGFGGPTQVETMRRLAQAVSAPAVFGLSRVNARDVDRVLTALAGARRPGINIFSPTSPQFLAHADATPDDVVRDAVRAIGQARGTATDILFSAQDAARADRAFLVEFLDAVIDAGATAISIPDTTSQALPVEYGALCAQLRQQVAGSAGVLWSVHCHNDLGLAVANCLAAIEQGAGQVECTIGGLGEGGGNTATHLLASALDARQDHFTAVRCALDLNELAPAAALLAAIGQASDDAGSGVVDLLRRWRPPADTR